MEINFKDIFASVEATFANPENYHTDTTPARRVIPFALQPTSRAQVILIVQLANKYSIKLYPISTGLNWGYGTSNPVEDGCVILDLSKLDKIVEINTDLNFLTIEPGVTQEKLHYFFTNNNLPYLVPVTGAGPKASILGNMLERGYGLTPHADHFGALLSLVAILPDGSLFKSELSHIGDGLLNKCFKWGIGPYLDGLFAQGNIGIVVEATISIAKIPEKVEMFMFKVESSNELTGTIHAVRECLQKHGAYLSGINLMNTRRMLAMRTPYFLNQAQEDSCINNEKIKKMAEKYYCQEAWTGIGAIYGTKITTKSIKKELKMILKKPTRKIVFLNRFHEKLLTILSSVCFGDFKKSIIEYQKMLNNVLNIFYGQPNTLALPVCYLKTKRTQPITPETNPAKDKVGLIWYSPLVPMNADSVHAFVALVENICFKHGIEPLITLTSISERCFDSTVPILYNSENLKEVTNAKSCYEELLEVGKNNGFYPYRFGVDHMNKITSTKTSFWDLVEKIKSTIDPKNIISPGRYSKKN